jgi:hypothetical protein
MLITIETSSPIKNSLRVSSQNHQIILPQIVIASSNWLMEKKSEFIPKVCKIG